MSEKKAKQERAELSELDKAKAILKKDQDERANKCMAEVNQVLTKWGFTLQPVATQAVMQGFMNVVSGCNINIVPKQQRDNGDKRNKE